MKDIGNFSILFFIFMFIYALIGMELFAFKVMFDENGEPLSEKQILDNNGEEGIIGSYPDSTFNTFSEAILSVFIILVNDGWSTIYIAHQLAVGQLKSNLFFLSLVMVGQYILLNLFIAILIKNFDEQSLEQDLEEVALKLQQSSSN